MSGKARRWNVFELIKNVAKTKVMPYLKEKRNRKELVARAIHNNSVRKSSPLLPSTASNTGNSSGK
ncbi:MAG: hypothetical protein IPL53_21550 [Ignavibacteria bacterium]|nr:hypothetical protein [Ignavibacteria bacterium]